jgi:glycosyltransferase involved in cell wall biosynthesis
MDTIKKPVVAMNLPSTGKGGGPFMSVSRIMNSGLKDKYDFKVICYNTELGRGISIKIIKDLLRQLKDINPDIVHFSGLQLSGFHMAIACYIYGIKNTLVTIRGTSADAIYFPWIKKIIATHIFENLTLLISKKNCGVSDYISKRTNILFRYKNIGTIYNIPPRPVKCESFIRKQLSISPTDIIIVSVARITKDKGYHVFDKSILKFKNEKKLKFILVGEGDYLSDMKLKLKEQINDKQVFFLGFREDVQQIIKGSDIFVLPTLHETLSNVLLEASVEGLALIASNTGGVPEIVKDGYNGILVEPGNENKLYNAILFLIQNKKVRNQYGINAKTRMESKFSPSEIELKIDATYQNLLK